MSVLPLLFVRFTPKHDLWHPMEPGAVYLFWTIEVASILVLTLSIYLIFVRSRQK